jgi:hypothetical protein
MTATNAGTITINIANTATSWWIPPMVQLTEDEPEPDYWQRDLSFRAPKVTAGYWSAEYPRKGMVEK